MVHELVMPQLGMTMTEGTVLRWLKAVGESVEKGEPIVEVQTDKVDMEVESPFTGYLTAILVQEGATVPVATRIGCLSTTPDADCASLAPDGPSAVDDVSVQQTDAAADRLVSTDNGATTSEAKASDNTGRVLVSPRARRVAHEFRVDLTLVTGSGEFGRIREVDVRRYLEDCATPAAQTPPEPARDNIRKVIADRLTHSVTTVPQFWLDREVDATGLVALRTKLLNAVAASRSVRLTYTDFLIKALALALREMPAMAKRWDGDRLVAADTDGIGFAAQGPDRLLVPVVHGADALSLAALAATRAGLVDKVQSGRLGPADMEGAVCTLSNLGAFGVDAFQAIINPPQSCILAVGRIADRAVVHEGSLVIRPTMRLVLTVDHRVVDGVGGAQFLSCIANYLENPETLLV